MRYLILTDMHGNWDAMETILRKVRRKRFDASLVLGDLVGYGGAPNQVVDAIRRLPGKLFRVRGNHDKVVAGVDDGSGFNDAALAAARWTQKRLTASNLRYVRELPQGPVWIDQDLAICHGSPLDEDFYVFSEHDAFDIFRNFPPFVTFFGHTHIPSAFVLHREGVRAVLLRGSKGRIRLQKGFRYLLNPGSVGQPRDRNPKAAYMTYDSERQVVYWHRIAYPTAVAQQRILRAGLPSVLAERLSYGV
jgi:predicted phosphodiesterase